MKFDLTSPCDTCPFRSNVAPFLTRKRVSHILKEILVSDKTFACHKTVYKRSGSRTRLVDRQHCAGALIMLYRARWPNWRFLVAGMLGLFNPRRLKLRSQVYATPEAMIEAQPR